MSEFTADRAGLLCCQNKEAAVRAFMKMAGMPIKEFNYMHTASFIKQAQEFKRLDYDAMNKMVKFFSIADSSHPWTVMRASELLGWMNSGVYDSIMSKEVSGELNEEYCKWCYHDGEYTYDTMDDLIDYYIW